MVTVGDVVYEVLTSGPLSSWVPDCLSSFLKEFRAPCCAVMLSSQLAILVQGRGETSRPVGQLSRWFLPDRMLDQWLHGRKSRERSLCPFHLAFKVATTPMVVLLLTIVCGLVYSGCPRSCLMAHSDREHPSVSSSGPAVPIAIKKKKAMIRTAMSLPGLQILVPRTIGSAPLHSLSPETATTDPLDPISRPETSSTGPNATRRQSVVYPKSAQRAYGSDEQRPNSAIRKGQLTRRRSYAPVPAPLFIFFSSHPPPRGALELELRRCRHTGGLQQSMDTITSHIPDPPAGHIRRSHRRYQSGEHGG